MVVFGGRSLRMAMDVMGGRLNRLLVHLVGVDMEDPRFVTIDPNSGVAIRGHGGFFHVQVRARGSWRRGAGQVDRPRTL